VAPGPVVDVLLRGVVDFAGMFPPARLDTGTAEAEYASYRAGPESWLVGTFVVAVDRLTQLDPATGPLSVVVNDTSPESLDQLWRLAGQLAISAVEFRPVPPAVIAALAAAVPQHIQAFFEVPTDREMGQRLDAIAACGAAAKIRTGGLTPDAFPDAAAVDRFFRACSERGVAAKATAGLHHALAGEYALTYEPQSANGAMFGFLNICAAAALVHAGSPRSDVLGVLRESSATAWLFDEHGMEWRGNRITISQLRAMRHTLFRSFGSCSLREPVDELKRMRLL
jgi:hypothetical protein